MLLTSVICSYVLTRCQWNCISVGLILRAVLKKKEYSGSLPIEHLNVCLTLSIDNTIVLGLTHTNVCA